MTDGSNVIHFRHHYEIVLVIIFFRMIYLKKNLTSKKKCHTGTVHVQVNVKTHLCTVPDRKVLLERLVLKVQKVLQHKADKARQEQLVLE